MKNNERQPWSNFVKKSNKHLVSDEAIDLLNRMVTIDHADRITAREALEHPYFDMVK